MGRRACHFKPWLVRIVTIRLNFVTRDGAKFVGGFEEISETRDLKKLEKCLASRLKRGEFMMGSFGHVVQVTEPMLGVEQIWQRQCRIFT